LRTRTKSLRSLDVDDLEDGGLIGSLFICAVQADDLAARLAETTLLGLLDGELEEVVGTLVRWDLEGSDTAGDVELAADLEGDGAGEDGDAGTVLSNETSKVASVGKDDNQVNVEVLNTRDSGGGEGLGGADGSGGEKLDVLEDALVVNAALGLSTALAHDSDGLDGVATVGGFAGEHDSIGTVKDGVSNVTGLSASRARGRDHRLKHLSGSDDGLAGNVSLLDHPFLGDEDLLRRDLHTEITTSDHDTISGSEDLIIVVEALLVLDLGNDLDVGTARPKEITDVLDVVLLADEGGSDHVDTLLEAELNEISLILLSQSGEVDNGAGEVHVLLLTEFGSVFADAHNTIFEDLSHFAGERAVSDIDDLADRDGLGKGAVRARDASVVALNCVVRGDLEILSGLESDRFVVDEVASADLRALSIEHDSAGLIRALLESFPEVGNAHAVGFVVTVREVETGDVHAGVEHADEHLGVPAGRADSADDLALAQIKVDRFEDVLETNVARVRTSSVCFYHFLYLLFLQKFVLVSVCVLGYPELL